MYASLVIRYTAVVSLVLLVAFTFLPVSRAQYQNPGGNQKPERNKAEHLSRGEAYLKESKFQEASWEFRNALQIDDKLADAHWGLARAYEGLQRYQEMVEELRKAVDLDPNNLEARIKLGNIYLAAAKGSQEAIKEAEKLAQQILDKDPNHIEGHILKGNVLFAQSKPAEALAELQTAVNLDPQRPESYLALAKYYLVTMDPEKAEATFKRAIEVNSNSTIAHTEYGKFLVQQRRKDEAEAELRKAVEVAPEDRTSRFVLASFYLVNKQLDKAEESYKALAALDRDRPEGQRLVADFYSSLNRLDEAIWVYQGILAKFPDYVPGRYRLAEILLVQGDTQGANAQIEEVLKKDTRDQQALLLRVRLRSVGNQPESLKAAIEDLKEILRQEPHSRSGLYYMAQTHLSLGLLDQARLYASDLENDYPNYLPGRLIHAQINLAAGNARSALTQASDLIDRLKRNSPDRDYSPKLLAELKQQASLVRDAAQSQIMKTTNYPVARKSDQTDTYHGVTVADPYRWLEDLDSTETRNWVEAENKLAFDYLAQVPARASIKDRLTKLWNYEKYGVPFKEGNRYFYSRNSGLQNQSVLYTVMSLEAQPQLLLDPNTLSSDGTVAVSGMSVSDDGKLLAYSLSSSGSDWQEWKVRNIETGQDLSDHLKWAKFSNASWSSDSKGFFYERYDEPKGDSLKDTNYFQKVCYHKLGTPQADDLLVYERPDQKDWLFGSGVSEDGNYLIITIFQGTDVKTRLYYKDLRSPDAQVTKLLDDFDGAYNFVGNDGNRFWIQTDQGAPRGRVIEIDINKPARSNWKVLVPESRDTLQSVRVVNNNLVANYLHDAYTQVKIFETSGKFIREVEFPGIGSADGFGGRPDDKETFYSFTGFTTPTTIYRYDLVTGKSTVFRQPKVDFNPADYETKQVFYPSKDGTKISMFLTYKKGIKLDGNNPTYLYGYGGFNISLTPGFSVSNLVWMELGGVYAQPNLRGGGEYGEEWHQDGSKLKKQNVFDDFIYAAQWLIANKYTSTPKLAIGGGSNGGLLVGAAMTQRPDLFGAALPAVGVMDMLRFQKFTIGWAWISDYGSSDNVDDFKTLYAYSPLHNIKPGTNYPATMVTTADHDDRVWPGHSFKFAAALQAAQAGPAPVLIRIETKAGHGAGKPTAKLIEESADRWAFLVKTLEMKS